MTMEFIGSGSTTLDLVLGGGWCLGRMSRVAGESSSGKTQLATQAIANFHKKYPQGKILYFDSEAAYDLEYGQLLGLPEEGVEFQIPQTVDEWSDSMDKFIKEHPANEPGFLVLDSLDTLLSTSEQTKKLGEVAGFEGGRRAADIGKVIKRAIPRLEEKNIHFMCVCQTRDNLSGFGASKIVGGGNAPVFYASQRLMLKTMDKLTHTVEKVEHIWGVRVEAFCDKNKCGRPFRKAFYTIVFNKGIDDVRSCLEWLESVKQLELLPSEILPASVGKEDKPEKATKEKEEKRSYPKTKLIIDRIAKIEDKAMRRAMISTVRVTTEAFWEENHAEAERKITFLDDSDDED